MTDAEVAKTATENLVKHVTENKARYAAFTTDFAEFPYTAEAAAKITYRMWVEIQEATFADREAIDALNAETNGGLARVLDLFGDADYRGRGGGRVDRDFTRVINGLTRGTVKSELGEAVELDRFGCPNIAPYMAGCRESISVPIDKVDDIDLKTFVAPWHGDIPTDFAELRWLANSKYKYMKDGYERAALPYSMLWPWDMYRIIVNLCAAGFERSIRGVLGGKAGAQMAAQLEDKAAVIRYENIDGVQVGYSKACNELDNMFMAEIAKDSPEYQLTYKPKAGEWGPTMELTLPRDEIRAWRAAGGNPQQLKGLRGAVYTLLKNEATPYWWRQYQVTLTIGQVEQALWGDDNRHMTDDERKRLLASFDLLTKTRIECTYPPKDRKTKYTHIDETKLAIHGLTLFPAIWVEETDARGNVVNAAFKFHAMPPLDDQANELRQAYTLPYLKGTPGLKAISGRVEATTIDVQTALAKYVRIAKAEGSQTVYIDSLTKEVEPFKCAEIIERTEWAEAVISSGNEDEIAEAKKDKKRLQERMRYLRARVKKDVLRVLPQLIENEAISNKPCYLNVDKARGNRDGFTITRVKPTDRQRKEHRQPNTHFSYGKKS